MKSLFNEKIIKSKYIIFISFLLIFLPIVFSGCNNLVEPIQKYEIQLYPNPARDYCNLFLKLNSETTISISINDFYGRNLQNVVENKILRPGDHVIEMNLSSLPIGNYCCVITLGDISKVINFTVFR